MITRDELLLLSEVESPEGCAVSFYFQPAPPQDKSHRGEAAQVRELVREAARHVPRNSAGNAARADLERILQMNELWLGNHARARAIFACGAKGVWRQYELPARLERSHLALNRRFHLTQLVALAGSLTRVCAVLVDRSHARIFDVQWGEVRLREEIFDKLPNLRAGFSGYEEGRTSRHRSNVVRQHLRKVSDRLQEMLDAGQFDKLVIACRDGVCAEVDAELHSYVKQRLLGRVALDPVVATPEDIRREVERLLEREQEERNRTLVHEVLGQGRRNGLGAIGLRRVMQALERGEARALVLGAGFSAPAAECRHCGHLDYRLVRSCAVCGQATRELDDVTSAIIARTLRGNVDVVWVGPQPALQEAGNIAALLRFRADRSTGQMLAG
ncbi:MAG: host attachment protein [Terriglobales bacterium]